MRRSAVVVAATLIIVLAAVSVAASSSKARTHKVVMEGNKFVPAVITVKSGDAVVWVNKDVVAHTATSTAAQFDSQLIDAGKSWKHTVRRKGEFPYVCTFHPMMTGVLRVE
jgi:plastocyanin